MPKIDQAKILIVATHGFEQSELMEPLNQLKEKGATVHVAAPESGEIRGWNDKDWGQSVDVDLTLSEVDAADYHALVLPGGQINPDLLRVDETAVGLVKSFIESGKIVAAVCHAPWLLIEADAVRGRDVTSYHSIKTDVVNAGGNWIDKEVVTDNGIITSRNPGDLPAFIDKIVEEVEEGRHDRAAA